MRNKTLLLTGALAFVVFASITWADDQNESWNPSDCEVAALEPVIRKYIFVHLSDQSPSDQNIPEVKRTVTQTNDQATINLGPIPSFDLPPKLTIEHIPLENYRREYLGTIEKKARRLIAAFFNPAKLAHPHQQHSTREI